MRRDEIQYNHPVSEEDVIMEIAAHAYRDRMNHEFDEIANDTDSPDLSPEAVERLHNDVMNRFKRLRKKKERRRRIRRELVAFATFVFCIAIGSGCVYAARANIANFIIQNFEQYSEIHYDAESNAQPPIGWSSPYYPTWLPEGTSVKRLQLEKQNSIIWFKDKDGYEFQFVVIPVANQIPAYDTENMVQEELTINEWNAILSYDEKRNIYTLMIPLSEDVIMIWGQLSRSEITKIAQRINSL